MNDTTDLKKPESIRKLEKKLGVFFKPWEQLPKRFSLDEKNAFFELDSQGKVTKLLLIGFNFSSLAFLLDFPNLTTLNLFFDRVSDISPITQLTNLSSLGLSGNHLADISPITQLTNLSSLDLSGNHLTDISPITQLTNLSSLDLSWNHLADITPITQLKNLSSLNLGNTLLPAISQLIKLNTLTSLDLSENQLSNITPICQLTNLTSLNLSGNPLSDISSITQLMNLTSLNLKNIHLSDISILIQLKNLTSLNLSGNSLSDISPLSQLKTLTSLDLSGNSLSDISPLSQLKTLASLDLSENPLSDISPLMQLINLRILSLRNNCPTNIAFLKRLTNLESLDLRLNQLSDISSLRQLTKLSSIDLSGNQLTNISPLNQLKNLTSLDLGSNQLTDISPLNQLKNLTSLDLDSNQLTDISPLNQLKNLTLLSLRSNYLSDISSLTQLINLTSLYLNNNQIDSWDKLPDFSGMKILQELHIDNNPLWKGTVLILEWGENHLEIVRNFQKLEKDGKLINVELPQKVILLGNHTAGKTALRTYLMRGKTPKRTNSTHVLNVVSYSFDKNNMSIPDVLFYDFGGQDFYHGVYRMFMSLKALYLLLYYEGRNANQNDSDSSNQYSNIYFGLKYWLEQKKFFESDSDATPDPALLIRTHADKENWNLNLSHEDLERYGIRELFHISLAPEKEIQAAKFKTGREYFRISFKTLVKEIKKTLKATVLYKKILKKVYEKWKKNEYQSVKLGVLGKEFNIHAKHVNISGWLDQMHRAGLVFYFKDDPDLKKVVWLNPHGVVEYIHKEILSKKIISEKKGILNKNDMKEFDPLLIKLLQKQKVIFYHNPNPKDIEYIVPNYLPLASESSIEYEFMTFGMNPDFTMKFKYFLPFGLMNQIICFFGNQPNKKKFWRDRMLFTFSDDGTGHGTKVMIALDFVDTEIKVFSAPDRDESRKKKIREYLFYAILRLYWDWNVYPSKNNDDYVNFHCREKFSDKELNNYRIRKKRLMWKQFCAYVKFRPEDLYISMDDEYFVHFRQLFTTPEDHQVDAYKKDSLGERPVKRLPVSRFNPFVKEEYTMKKVFISYSHEDMQYRMEAQKFLVNLVREGLIEIWHDAYIEPGTHWDDTIQNKLKNSDIVILLVSQDFISSDYVNNVELRKALEQCSAGKTRIFPVLLKECDWLAWKTIHTDATVEEKVKTPKISDIQFLPKDENEKLIPLREWAFPEKAWQKLTGAIRTFCSNK